MATTAEDENDAFANAISISALFDTSVDDRSDLAEAFGVLARQVANYKAGTAYWRGKAEALQAENDRLWARINED